MIEKRYPSSRPSVPSSSPLDQISRHSGQARRSSPPSGKKLVPCNPKTTSYRKLSGHSQSLQSNAIAPASRVKSPEDSLHSLCRPLFSTAVDLCLCLPSPAKLATSHGHMLRKHGRMFQELTSKDAIACSATLESPPDCEYSELLMLGFLGSALSPVLLKLLAGGSGSECEGEREEYAWRSLSQGW